MIQYINLKFAQRQHTAVKIRPCYKGPTIHVLDASKSVVVCSSLLAKDTQRDDFLEYIHEEYEEIRADYFQSLKEKKYLSLAECRRNKLKINWNEYEPIRPKFLGRKVLNNYDINELVPFIDWKPFFDVWQLRGKYPNRGFPKIFNDETVGAEAKRIYNEAKILLNKFIRDKSLTANSVISFHQCNSNNSDDILIYDDNLKHTYTLHGLRQQVRSQYSFLYNL